MYQRQVQKTIVNGTGTSQEFDAEDINQNNVMAVLSYFVILFLIPLLAAPNSKFARFHANQGLVLCILSVVSAIVIGIISAILTALMFFSLSAAAIVGGLFGLIWAAYGIFVFVLAIMGIVNAAQGKAKELPIIGKFKIIK